MKNTIMIRNTINKYKENELIFASKLYKNHFAGTINEPTFYKAMERMNKAGELSKIAKGIYCKPKRSKYGIIPPSEQEIISPFTENELGMEIGYPLYNTMNISTQISKHRTILSSAIDGFSKSIKNITIKKQEIVFTEPIKAMIAAMEIFQNFKKIQDLNYKSFINFTKNFAANYSDEIFSKINQAMKYKKSTIAFAKDVLRYYKVKNNLDKYLSALSTYDYPKMEEIYAATYL